MAKEDEATEAERTDEEGEAAAYQGVPSGEPWSVRKKARVLAIGVVCISLAWALWIWIDSIPQVGAPPARPSLPAPPAPAPSASVSASAAPSAAAP